MYGISERRLERRKMMLAMKRKIRRQNKEIEELKHKQSAKKKTTKKAWRKAAKKVIKKVVKKKIVKKNLKQKLLPTNIKDRLTKLERDVERIKNGKLKLRISI